MDSKNIQARLAFGKKPANRDDQKSKKSVKNIRRTVGNKLHGASESNLGRLWRLAVLKVFGGRCFFCGAHFVKHDIECHHTVKRNNFLTRFDWRVAVPCCKWEHSMNEHLKMSCHRYAETPWGRKLITEYQDKHGFVEYLTERNCSAKQWLVERGKTKNDHKQDMLAELKGILSDERLPKL